MYGMVELTSGLTTLQALRAVLSPACQCHGFSLCWVWLRSLVQEWIWLKLAGDTVVLTTCVWGAVVLGWVLLVREGVVIGGNGGGRHNNR